MAQTKKSLKEPAKIAAIPNAIAKGITKSGPFETPIKAAKFETI